MDWKWSGNGLEMDWKWIGNELAMEITKGFLRYQVNGTGLEMD